MIDYSGSERYLCNENQLINLQNKIREQAKRLCSMQEYISLLEKKIKEFNPNVKFPLSKENLNSKNDTAISYQDLFQKYNNLQQKYNDLYETSKNNFPNQINSSNSNEIELTEENLNKLKNEKEEIMSQLKKEIINNDEQRNYIEILKQALETNISKHGLKNKIDYLKNKYYPNCEIDEYAPVILDLSQLKERNDALQKEKVKNLKNIENLQKNVEILENTVNSYNKLNSQHNDLIKDNNILKTEYDNLQNKLNEKEKNLIELKEKYLKTTEENNILNNENENLKFVKKDNETLAKSVSDLGLKLNQLSYDNNNLKDYQSRYEILLKENNEIKKINQCLSCDNNNFKQNLDKLNLHIQHLNEVNKCNMTLKNQLQNLSDNFTILNNEKNKNENLYMTQLRCLTNEKNELENIIAKQQKIKDEEALCEINSYKNDNKKLYDFNKKLTEENNRYILENKFYMELIFRMLKFHIPNLNVKNLICELVNLIEKRVKVTIEIQKMEKYYDKIIIKPNICVNDKKKIDNELYELKKQINDINIKIENLEDQLKNYEI